MANETWTKRDEIAALFLQGILTALPGVEETHAIDLARKAYAMADGFMAARNGSPARAK